MLSHRLRDTFAVDLLEKGVPLEEVSKLLAHESIRTTERHYAKWVKERQDRLDQLGDSDLEALSTKLGQLQPGFVVMKIWSMPQAAWRPFSGRFPVFEGSNIHAYEPDVLKFERPEMRN
jgi:DNA-binding transcriptional MerR regulator